MIFTDTVCNYLISRTVTARVEIRKGSRKNRKEGREGKNTPRIFPSIWEFWKDAEGAREYPEILKLAEQNVPREGEKEREI